MGSVWSRGSSALHLCNQRSLKIPTTGKKHGISQIMSSIFIFAFKHCSEGGLFMFSCGIPSKPVSGANCTQHCRPLQTELRGRVTIPLRVHVLPDIGGKSVFDGNCRSNAADSFAAKHELNAVPVHTSPHFPDVR